MLSSHHFFKIKKKKNYKSGWLVPKEENVRSRASPGLGCLKRTVLLCYKKYSVVLSADMLLPGDGPFSRKLGGLQQVSPITNGMWWLEFSIYTSGSHNRTGLVRPMVQTVPLAQAVIVREVQPIKLGTCKWPRTLRLLREDPSGMLQYYKVQKHWQNVQFCSRQHVRIHSSEKLHSLKCCSPQNCSLEDSILAVLGSAEVPSVSLCTLKQPCVGGLFRFSLKLQHHGRW